MGLVGCMLLGFSTWNTASAAVLTLLDWTSIPVPSGANHADLYEFPHWAFPLTSANPITQVEMDYNNLPFVEGMGIHEIKSAQFLFNSGDLATTAILMNTTERYWARIVFITPFKKLTGLTDTRAPAFLAYHGPSFGSALTSALWTVTYQDGTTLTADNGIIPEPGCAAFIAIASTMGLFQRRVPRRH